MWISVLHRRPHDQLSALATASLFVKPIQKLRAAWFAGAFFAPAAKHQFKFC